MEKFSPEAKTVLKIGHKFAFNTGLKHSLALLINNTEDKFQGRINTLTQQERDNWKAWKLNSLRYIARLTPRPSEPLSRVLRKGIQDLKDMNVIVKQADKNFGLVAIRGDIYNGMLWENLNEPTYVKVKDFPHTDILNRMTNILRLTTSMRQWEKERAIKFATQAKDACPFYVIPKLHKKKLGSRPISPQHSYMLAPLSKALAKTLQEVANGFMEIAKDSKDVVRRLETFNTNTPFVFVTYDVEKLYPSIDLKDAIKTLEENLHVMKKDHNFWTKVLQLIMYNNYVTAQGQTYRQMTGTATGTQVAPPFANLYLYFKFKEALDDEDIIFQSRYIDDGLLMVKTEGKAQEVMNKLNQASNLKLTYEISPTTATYLDITVYKGRRFKEQQTLDLKVYFKPTNKLLYLPAKSHHPGAMKNGIVVGEAIRTLRNTSDKEEWLKAMAYIFKGLIQRGYEPTKIKQKWKRIKFEDRDKYIYTNTTRERPEKDTVLTWFNDETYKHWKLLLNKHPIAKVLIQKTPGRYNKQQQAIMDNWPPNIIYHEFNKLGKKVISSKAEWQYPRLHEVPTQRGPRQGPNGPREDP